jgi:hypothetical protein
LRFGALGHTFVAGILVLVNQLDVASLAFLEAGNAVAGYRTNYFVALAAEFSTWLAALGTVKVVLLKSLVAGGAGFEHGRG